MTENQQMLLADLLEELAEEVFKLVEAQQTTKAGVEDTKARLQSFIYRVTEML